VPFGALLPAIDTYEGTPEVKAALQLLALTFGRPGELRNASWCASGQLARKSGVD
jgi:hypothetical protein